MEANKILNTDLLDIVFEKRNKEYGAYQLRKGYNHRLLIAMAAVAAITAMLFVARYIAGRTTGQAKPLTTVVDVQLEEVKEEKKNEPPPPPPPPKMTIQKIEITRFTPPKIVKDNEVKEEEKPPEQAKLEETKIGTINQEGVKDEGIVAPPATDVGKGVVEAPKKKETEDYDKTFTKVEIESEYPGGPSAWLRYLTKNFRYPDDAISNDIQGIVVVQFIVDKDGNVSDVHAISGPEQGGLRQEAIRVIKQSGKWIPAVQNGRQVKSYKKQPVVFKLEQQ
jgi:protein TonB